MANSGSKALKVVIVGAGPIGCYAGYLLAKQGFDVNIYERSKKIGVPVQCTGIISKNIREFFSYLELKDSIVNRVNGAKIISPDGNSFTVRTSSAQAIIIDRTRFDSYIAKLALSAGAKIHMRHEYKDFRDGKIIIENNMDKHSKRRNELVIDADILIGADGPLSHVAKTCGLYQKDKRKFLVGLQHTIRSEFPKDIVELDLGVSRDFFGWVVPEHKGFVRIGVASRHDTRKILENYIKKHSKKYSKKYAGRYDKSKKTIKIIGGIIPVYTSKLKIQNKVDNVKIFLVGDSAPHIKNTTGGGIVMGLKAATCLVDSIVYDKDYMHLLRKRIGKDLLLAAMIRKMLNAMSDRDKNLLIKIMKKNKNVLIDFGDMDYPTRFIAKLLFKDPRLIFLGLRHLPDLFWK